MPWWFGVRTGSGPQSPYSLGRQGRITLTLSFCQARGLIGARLGVAACDYASREALS